MVSGVALVALGFVLPSRIETLWGFYAAVIIIAIGVSATGGPVGMVAIAHWFRRRRALAMMTVGAGASGLMVLVLAALIAAVGWRDALVIMAIVQLAICLPLAMSIRNRPQEMGLLVDGVPFAPLENDEAPPMPAAEGLTAREALRTGTFWKRSIAAGLTNLGVLAIVVHQIPVFTGAPACQKGWPRPQCRHDPAKPQAGWGFGHLADSVDKRYVMAAAYATTAVALLLYATVYRGWQVLYVLPVFGVGFGGSISVRPALQAEFFGLKAFGAIQGLAFTIATRGGLACPVFAGWLYDMTDSYRLAFASLSAGSLLAVPLVLSVRKPVPAAATVVSARTHVAA